MQSRRSSQLLGGLLAGFVLATGAAASELVPGPEALPLALAPSLPPEIAPDAAAVAPEPVLPPEAAAFRAAVRAETAALDEPTRFAIEQFYADRGFTPFWGDANRAQALIEALEDSPAQGLPYRRYDPAALALMFSEPAEATTSPGQREVAATRSYLQFAGDLSGGILRPSRVDIEINLAPERPDAAALLARLNTAAPAEVLAGLEPQGPDYRRLIAEKARLEELTESDAWGPGVAQGPTLHRGDSGPRIADLRARLARLGYLAAGSGVAGSTYDADLAHAVEHFQRDHGLGDDGTVGAHTLAEINATAAERWQQVVVNLERMRWTGGDFGPRYILVNIPDFTAVVFENSQPTFRSKVVVGEAEKTRTPEFSDVISFMVVNPTWHVPDSIAKRVYLPKLRGDPSLLDRTDMQLMTRNGTVINPHLVDFATLGDSFPFRIKQKPSAANALGKVKFMFPNQFSIYLHDTPHRELFAKDTRDFSNGCIRLEKPDELAFLLLQGQADDPQQAFAGWVAAKAERTIRLDRPIPVHIVYRSVFFDADGTVHFRDDIYGRDAEVFEALQQVGVTLPAAQG